MLKLILSLIVVCCFNSLAQAQDGFKVTESYGNGSNVFSLATGSPGELGLLKELGEAFAKKENAKLDWIKAGSGESIELLRSGKVDMIMVHAPAAEKKAVSEGWAVKRELLGSNEFFIVGPKSDPAKISGSANAAEVYAKIAAAKAKFFSRGDDSGTHKKELAIWKTANLTPSGDWYIVHRDFMSATLKRANDENGYFMTDSSTWASNKKSLPNLVILFQGDKVLINTYHTLVSPPGKTPGAATAAKFVDFVCSPEGQKIISEYGKAKHGEAIYNDAAYAKKYDD